MRVYCLGGGGYYPTNDTHTICFMIPEAGIIIDAGSGLFRAIELVQTDDIHIFLTHTHSDHTLGLAYLNLFYKKTKVKNIFIHASEEALNTITNIFKPPFIGSPIQFTPVVFNTDKITLQNGVEVQRFPVIHSVECFAYRFDISGHSLAFVTDTTSNENSNYIDYVKGVNFLIHECYLTASEDGKSKGHTSSVGLISFLKKTGVSNVWLIHHNPNNNKNKIVEEVKAEFPHADLAIDNAFFEF